MTRFEFPLDRLLALRRQLVRRAEAAQARARLDVTRATAAADAARAALDRHADATAAGVGRTTTVLEWHAAADRTEGFARTIADRDADVAAAQAAYAAADRERARLAREVDALATLRGQRWEEWSREAAKADQERLDEIGVRRWTLARSVGREDG